MSDPDLTPSIPRWPTVSAGEIEHHVVFGFQDVVRRSPRTGAEGTYKILHMPSWTNVVARTCDGGVVLVEQYRHGLDAVTLEIPGGVVEDGEDPAVAAARELAEETGYSGDEAVLLGTVHPNPAIQNNACTTWLIDNAKRTAEPDPDPGEHLEVHVVPLGDIPDLLRGGRITHSLVVAAFQWLHLHDRMPPIGASRA